jgi:hypothetical protein
MCQNFTLYSVQCKIYSYSCTSYYVVLHVQCICWPLYSYSTVLPVHDDHCTPILQYYLVYVDPRAQNLWQGIIMKTSFKTRVSWMGLGSFVDINLFVMKYYFIDFLNIFHFFRTSLIKIYTNVKTPKWKLGSFV